MRPLVLLALCLCPALAKAATVESFDLKGSTNTCGAGIGSNGLVAGSASGGNLATELPFLYRTGQFEFPKSALPPGAVFYVGVNRWRTIAGFVFDGRPGFTITNFINRVGILTSPTIDGATVTSLAGVNDQGEVLGSASVGTGFNLRTVGFIQPKFGHVTLIDDGSYSIQPRGMDAHGDHVVGVSIGPAGTQSWSFTQAGFTPVSMPGASRTEPTGVDEAGRISGTYAIGPATVPAVTHGFFLLNGAYTSWDVPGASSTSIRGANETGQVTGCYTDIRGTHGFIRTP